MNKFADLLPNKFEDLLDEKPAEAFVPGFSEFSVAWCLQFFIRARNGCEGKRGIRTLGTSHQYTLERLQTQPIGKIDARKLTEDDIIKHCEMRRESVKAATINQDIGYLQGALRYAKGAPGGCKTIATAALADVRTFLKQNGYIGKSTPRKRMPTEDEKAKLIAFFKRPPKKKNKSRIEAMPDIIEFSLKSTRRISEICSITRSDVDWDHKDDEGNPAPLYTVRNMKHPRKKNHTKTFPLYPDLSEILLRQPVKPGDDRFFPFRSKSVGAKYTRAKKTLGIEDLHFHDSRRRAITTRLKTMSPHQVRHFFSGHDSEKVFIDYDATDPADGHAVARQQATTQSDAAQR